jgi:hypothetical protein
VAEEWGYASTLYRNTASVSPTQIYYLAFTILLLQNSDKVEIEVNLIWDVNVKTVGYLGAQ